MRLRLALALMLALILVPIASEAHRASDSFLTLTVEPDRITGRWDIALRDLDHAIGLDANDDGAITWGELRIRHAAIAAYALTRLGLSADDRPCTLDATDHLVERHGDGAYAVLEFAAACSARGPVDGLSLSYGLFFELDPQHRGLLQLVHSDGTVSAIFAPDAMTQRFTLQREAPWRQFAAYTREGVHHIWIGFDHILFLLTLLLPAALWWRDGRWVPVSRLPTAFVQTAGIVTAFTAAHSLTLALAVFDVIVLPPRLIEAAIAASVIIAAINNLVPFITRRLWLMAFSFGLVHGFGFAGVLADLGLPSGALATSLLGFNFGVELGQMAIVVAALPLLFLLRRSRLYARLALPAGSLAAAAIGAIWLLERVAPLP